MAKLMKKMTVGNPLVNLHLWDDLDEYERIDSDESLANWFHKMLNKYSNRTLVCSFIQAMIVHATDHKVNIETLNYSI